jgi:catechol 2,3-dioxygenase-like lactoylglutathione lyase family enzyme
MLTALDHVILAVRDLRAAEADYRRVLGLAPSWRGVHPETGTANVLFRVDNTYLELLSPDGDGPVGGLLSAWLEAHGDGLLGLAFATPDLEACRVALAARGLAPGPVEPGHGVDATTGAERRWQRAALPMDRTRGVLLFPIQHDSPADALPLARAEGDHSDAVHALDHVVLQTTDGDAVKALYGDALGLRLALDKEFPDWGVRLMFFRVGGVTVEAAAVLTDAEASKALPGGRGTGDGTDRLYGMSWRVGDLDAAHARLAAAGVDVSEIRKGRRPNTRVFTVRDSTCGVPTLVLAVEPGTD